MDWITHYMAAFIIGRKFRFDKEQMMAVTLGALILDIDIFYYLFPGTVLPVHGTLTHTLGGAVVLGLACTAVLLIWKKKMLAHIIALGIISHLLIDMINTLSIFDDGKRLLYPITDMAFSLKDSVPFPDIAWAILAAAIFSFTVTMLAFFIYQKDYPWRVWYDERPLVEYWRGKIG